MNTQHWNTPPNGDFASYVERLSERATVESSRQAEEHRLDVGIDTPTTDHEAATERTVVNRYSVSGASPGEQARGSGSGAARHHFAKALAILWFGVLAVMLVMNVALSVVLAVFVFGLWLGYRLRRWALPPGTENWRQWLEEEARKQKARQDQMQQRRKGQR